MTERPRAPRPATRGPLGAPNDVPPPPAAAPADAPPPDELGGDPGEGDAVAEWVGGALLADAGAEAWHDARFVAWLADEARAADRAARRAGDAAFLARGEALLARAQARQLGVYRYAQPPASAPRPRRVRERPAHALHTPHDGTAPARRVVPVVELGVAAGPGRDLWDEPPERWMRVPAALPDAPYVALRVVGTSMSPMLRSGDVVLVRTDARAARAGRVVVARHPDDGYVCKRVRAAGPGGLELDSLEPGHPPLVLPPDPALVVGTVVAAWPGR